MGHTGAPVNKAKIQATKKEKKTKQNKKHPRKMEERKKPLKWSCSCSGWPSIILTSVAAAVLD